MSNGDDVLDNWEEIDEAGLCMTLQKKLQTDAETESTRTTPSTVRIASSKQTQPKMKVLQRPQSMSDNDGSAKPILLAKKPPASGEDEQDAVVPTPVLMVLHKSASEYDAANYATPISNQTVKILRRPAQAEERRDTNGMRPKQPIKTLQQREQEYAEARLRILGAAKNPEDDKPATPSVAAGNGLTTTPTAPPPVVNNNNNNSGSPAAVAGMHRSSSAPKMTQQLQQQQQQQSPQCYNNYNSYFQAQPPPPAAALNYFYQQAAPPTPLYQQQQQQHQQLMSPYGVAATPPPQSLVNGPPQQQQQSWSPVVGGSVSAALLRQQQQPTMPHAYNDNILRLPRGPCPNGSVGFQMRR